MKMWLTLKLFGSGHGLAAPSFPQAFYWCDDRFYTWIGGFGAQLRSFEWSAPCAGTERTIFGKRFRVFNVSCKWPMVDVSWAVLEPLPTADDIRKLKKELLP